MKYLLFLFVLIGCSGYYENGKHFATVEYHNPKTGFSNTYKLSVEVKKVIIYLLDQERGRRKIMWLEAKIGTFRVFFDRNKNLGYFGK